MFPVSKLSICQPTKSNAEKITGLVIRFILCNILLRVKFLKTKILRFLFQIILNFHNEKLKIKSANQRQIR